MKKYFVLIAFVLLSGCATVPLQTMPIQDTFEVSSAFNDVWKAVVATVSEKSLPIKVIEKDSGIISTEFVIFADGYNVDNKIKAISKRPSMILGTWNSGRYSINIYAQSIDKNTTRIKITPHIEAYENNVSKSWHVCNSKGVLEKEIFDSLMAKIKK